MEMLEEQAVARKSSNKEVELEEEISKLAHLIYTHSPYDGSFNQRIPGLYVNRYSRTETDIVKTFQSPFLLLVVQVINNMLAAYGWELTDCKVALFK